MFKHLNLVSQIYTTKEHFTDAETKAFLIKNNLKEPLEIAGEWRWKD